MTHSEIDDVAPAPDAASSTSGQRKHFVLDTNVLLYDPNSLFHFTDNEVVIPLTVLEELDKLKRSSDEIGRNARHAIRLLDGLRRKGRLVDGVKWNDSGGEVRVALDNGERCPYLHGDSPDGRIITIAWRLRREDKLPTVFVTKDINARIRADAIGVTAVDFESRVVDAEQMYTGYREIEVPGDLIDELFRERQLPLEVLTPYLTTTTEHGQEYEYQISCNQFVLMRNMEDDSQSGLARRLADTNHLIPVTGPRRPVFGILARNVQQTMALDLLLDDDIKMITMIGSAGTGKTLLALAAGMMKVYKEEVYDKLLVARPIMPLGKDIGYLPGDKDEKLSAWMQPIFDNLGFLMSTRGTHMNDADSQSTEQRVRRLVNEGKLVLEPLTYIRGRSIPHQFLIVDEAQNLSPHEVKTIASRVGEGTKLILTGDVQQIDHPYLDAESNGLSHAIERLKGSAIVGHVTLAKSERSELASLASEML